MKKKSILAFLLIISLVLCGCKAYTEHKRTYKYAVGTWHLNSTYINTVSQPVRDQTLILRKDGTATIIVTTTVPLTEEQQKAVAAGQEITPETTTSEVDYKLTSENDTITLTSPDGGSATYTFSVDTKADDLHMYVTVDGVYYHDVYYLVEE